MFGVEAILAADRTALRHGRKPETAHEGISGPRWLDRRPPCNFPRGFQAMRRHGCSCSGRRDAGACTLRPGNAGIERAGRLDPSMVSAPDHVNQRRLASLASEPGHENSESGWKIALKRFQGSFARCAISPGWEARYPYRSPREPVSRHFPGNRPSKYRSRWCRDRLRSHFHRQEKHRSIFRSLRPQQAPQMLPEPRQLLLQSPHS